MGQQTRLAQEISPSYIETTPDTGEPLPAYLEPFIFPKYSTDDIRQLSLLEMVDDIAESIVERCSSLPCQVAFSRTLGNLDDELLSSPDFFEVRRRIWQRLPESIRDIVRY